MTSTQDQRSLLQAFVASLTNGGKNAANCLRIDHDELRSLIGKAAYLPAPDTAGEVVASSRCPVCGLDEPHQHNAFEAMELRHRRFPATNDEWLRYVGRKIDPTMINELDLLHKKAVRLASVSQPPATGGDAAFLRNLARRMRDVPAVHIDGGDIDELLSIAAALTGGAEGEEAPSP